MDRRYSELRILSKLFRIFAYIGAIGGFLSALFQAASISQQGVDASSAMLGALVMVLAGGVYFLLFIGLAHVVDLLVETREAVAGVNRRVRRVLAEQLGR